MVLLSNQALVVAFIGWACAQALKVFIELIQHRRLNLERIAGAGGMPSSHTSLVTALATAIGQEQGLSSPIFALAAIFACVVMYDAAGVRRAVSIQARLLNRMMDDFFARRGFDQGRMRELVGHTPLQVIAGALLGLAIGLLFG